MDKVSTLTKEDLILKLHKDGLNKREASDFVEQFLGVWWNQVDTSDLKSDG